MDKSMTLNGVCAAYGEKPVLHDITMDIPKGSITAVIGPSGCGKTTLLHCMNGLLCEQANAAVSGEILLNGKDIRSIPDNELRRRVGLVFQTPAPFPFSIYKNMTYALKYYGMHDKTKLDRTVSDKLRICGLYEEVKSELGKSALSLSGGQQQRLCIARALTVEPEVLLLDEPCSALDVKASAVIEELLVQLKKDYTIVIVTHNIAQARRIAGYAAFLYDGALKEFNTATEFFNHPRSAEAQDFLSGVCG